LTNISALVHQLDTLAQAEENGHSVSEGVAAVALVFVDILAGGRPTADDVTRAKELIAQHVKDRLSARTYSEARQALGLPPDVLPSKQ